MADQLSKEIVERLKASREAPQTKQFVDLFVRKCGGMEGFVERIYEEAENAPAGSQIKQRAYSMVLDGMKFLDRDNPKPEELSILSDTDLIEELKVLLAKVGHVIVPAEPGGVGTVPAVVPDSQAGGGGNK